MGADIRGVLIMGFDVETVRENYLMELTIIYDNVCVCVCVCVWERERDVYVRTRVLYFKVLRDEEKKMNNIINSLFILFF